MSLNIETGINLKYTDEIGTHYLYEGDKVLCHVGEHTYNGTISWIGIYKENADSEPQQVIYIDTWKGRTSMSREMVMLKDITNIRKNPFSYDINDETCSDGRKTFNVLTEKGYSKEQAKAICDRTHDMTKFYCIPYIKATIYAIEVARQLNTSDKNDAKDIIMEGAKQCMEEAQKEYFELVDIYAKEIEQCNRDINCLTDTIGITTKCWNDLRGMKECDVKN
ncbi:MAG: hypothetical protein K1W35_15715 [Lachnospiraceae bacterium]